MGLQWSRLRASSSNKLTWSKNTKTVVKRARQNLFPLRRLKRFGMGPQTLKRFYSCTIKSILTVYITAWYCNCSASNRKALHRVVRTAQYITGAKLPAIQDLYTRQCQRKALKIVKDSSHPSHILFSLLPHGKRYWSAMFRSKRLLNSFFPQAIRLLNILSDGYHDYLQCPRLYTTATLCCHLCILTLITLPTCTYYLN